MGDVWLPDRPLLIPELKAALVLLEEDCIGFTTNAYGQGQTGLTVCLMISGFFGALRGEEIVRINARAMIMHWDKSISHPDAPHVPLMLVGRFSQARDRGKGVRPTLGVTVCI